MSNYVGHPVFPCIHGSTPYVKRGNGARKKTENGGHHSQAAKNGSGEAERSADGEGFEGARNERAGMDTTVLHRIPGGG